jgi:hypothetical protein
MANVFLRFRDLKKKNIVRSWTALRNLVLNHGFPPGVMFSPNVRAWDETVVDAWLATRPTAGPSLRGAAKRAHDKPPPTPAEIAARAERKRVYLREYMRRRRRDNQQRINQATAP